MQDIIIIAAMAENRVIGKNNKMPWSIKGNLLHFKETTMGWPCLMGRKTWESLPKKPLPGRLNIVISKTMTGQQVINSCEGWEPRSAAPGTPCFDVKNCDSLSSAIEYCSGYEKIFICGGQSIYTQAMPLANKIELTMIPGQYDGDTFFPEIDNACWTITNTINFGDFSVVTYNKINRKEQV